MQGSIHQFRPGDRVLRINPAVSDVEKGHVYTVADNCDLGISLVGVPNCTFSPWNFKLVDRGTPEGPYQEPTNTTKESDPNGIDQHTPGAKLDNGKPRPGLVLGAFSKALSEVVKVGTFGANKYSDHGWLSVPNGVERYTDAMLRHHFAEAGGERDDPESKLSHAAHRAWNALAVLELMLRNKEKANAST